MIKSLQDELYFLEIKQANGAKICANIRWNLEGEKCPKTFFKILERQHMQNQTMSEIYTDDKKSKYSSNPKDVLKSAKNFDENLYTRENLSTSAINEFLNKIPNNKIISNEHFTLYEVEISLDKIIESINFQKKNNKSHGNDGLTAKFYKHFSNEQASILLEVYGSWKELGITGISSRMAIISVIYKKGDKKDIENYRPISLLNLDYEIYTTILKHRMQQTLDNIIGENQTAAIKNRTILHTFFTIRDIIDVSNKLSKNLSVMSLDFLKGFDRLDLDFIFLAMKKLGYGENFIHMIKVCYNNIQSKIKINGSLSDPFTLIRGVRQGCSLSMLLYIIVAEVLANFIIAKTRVKGVQIGHQEIKIVNFADDTTIFLRDIDCLNRIQTILELYEKASSSKINLSKSQALWAGGYKNRYDKPRNMKWSNLSIKLLGINFENFVPDNSNRNKISIHIAKRIHFWNRVRLSLRGKKVIINPILLSKLWYIAHIYTISKYIKKEIEKRIYNFLLEGKKMRPPRHPALLPIWKGGLGILDVDTQLNSLKIKWIQRLFHPTNALWKNFMLDRLNLIFNSN